MEKLERVAWVMGGVLYVPQASQEEQVLLLLHLLLPIFPVVIDSLCEWATKILN